MKKLLRVSVVLAMVGSVIVTAGAAVDVPGSADRAVPSELIVGLAAGVDPAGVAAALGGQVDRVLLSGDAFVLTVGNPIAAAALAANLPGVRYAEPNWIRQLHTHGGAPNDTDFHLKWDLENDGDLSDGGDVASADADIDFKSAYDELAGASLTPTIVAILDTGIDASHPDLNDKLVTGYDALDGAGAPTDGFGHGTHVAGIAAAETNNGTGTAGVGFHAAIRIMAVKVCDDNGSCPSSAIADGVTWAVSHGAKVINMSFGGPESSSAEINAFDAAHAAGVLLVASAGNSDVSTQNYPAAHPPVMAIAATDWDDGKASYSNFGASWVDLAAPGGDMDRYDDPEGIYSTMPTYNVFLTSCRARGLLSPCYDLNYDQLAGTSMAAPQVAGAGALLFAMGAADNLAVRGLLESSADGIPGTGNLWANGRLNIGSAVAAAGGVEPVLSIDITSPVDGATVSGDVPLEAAVSNASETASVSFHVNGSVIAGSDEDVDGTWTATWSTSAGSPGDDSYQITATVTDESGPASDSVTVTLDNDADPTVTVTSPEDQATVNGTVTVTATASDDLGVNQVEFFVDGGSIGVGALSDGIWSVSWDTTGFTEGSTTVTAVATDTAGQTASDSVGVTVDNVQDPAISLSATAYKVRGLQKADLSWSGATSTHIDVYRNGALVATTPNDWFHTDPIDARGGGSYVYVVCEAGTSDCSNEATASY